MDQRTREDLLAAVRRCGRYPAAAVSAAADALADGSTSDEAAADALHACGVLTPYQFKKVRAGRTQEVLFGPFLVLAKVGEGGMGKVYHAVQTAAADGAPAGRELALKIVRNHLVMNRTVMRRYEREAAAAAALDHPNIVKLFAASDVHGRYYLAMEYVNGVDLSRLVKEFADPPRTGLTHYQEACEYARQAALGLQHAHSRGLIHRDVKPANLLVSGERALPGTHGKALVKILDMGLVRSTLDDDHGPGAEELTRDGTVVGTPDYMSPEQAKNSSTVDPRADLYSLGCTLYYLLRGQPPFPDGTPIDKLLRHQLDPVPDLRRARPDLPAGVADVVAKLMQKKPSDRYQTAAQTAAALAPFAGGTATVPAYEPFSFTDDPDAVYAGPPSVAPGSAAAPPAESAPPPAQDAPAPSVRLKVKARPPGAEPGTTGPLPKPAKLVAGPAPPRSGAVPAPPKSGVVARPRSPVAIPKPADAPSSDSLPGTSRTPARPIPRPRRRREPQEEKPVPAFVWWAGGVLVLLAVAGALVLALSTRTRPDPKPDAPAGDAPAPAPAAPPAKLSAVDRRVPHGAAAVAVFHPEEYVARAQYQKPGAKFGAHLDRLAAKRQFDVRRFRRAVVSFTAGANPVVAVGEGEFVSPEFRAAFAARRTLAGAPQTAQFPAGPRYAAVLDAAYAVGSDARALAALTDGQTAAGWEAYFPADNPPLARFVALADYRLPTGGTLKSQGVTKLTATVRLTPDGVDLTVVITARSGGVLEEFTNLFVVTDLHDRFPESRPFVDALLPGATTASPRPGETETTLRGSMPWDKAHAALEALLPAADGE